MRCPNCGNLQDRVIDSRVSRDGRSIRRRRECVSCRWRFTTYERIEGLVPIIVKRDGRRVPYDRNKIFNGLLLACKKRGIDYETLEKITEKIESEILSLGVKEISTDIIGEKVMEELKKLDDVAYVRFASVYRKFKDASQFVEEIRSLYETPEKTEKKR
ncbi:MAG: transcriptional repressor NrdR [Deltaproteobacteria bacterium]|nr:MAG: transcriptional repressor NrdR [Deltaproteobacteria bacterium]